MNFIKNPNLPERSVKYIVIDNRAEALFCDELNHIGVNRILVPADKRLQAPVNSHADMHLFHSDNGNFYTSDSFHEAFTEKLLNVSSKDKDCEIFNNRRVVKELEEEYPGDVLLNAVVVGKHLICNTKTVCKEILDYNTKNVIDVKQGYAKCSICAVSEEAIITDDISIYKATNKHIDVLLVDHSGIELKGYNYGFIGGCCGKLSKNYLCFMGDLKSSKYSDDIKSFCNNHSVECISLKNGPLLDYGSILPIIEE